MPNHARRVVATIVVAVIAGSTLLAAPVGAAEHTDRSKERVVRVKQRPLPRTFATAFGGRLAADGTAPKSLALAAFTTAFGPLPGAKRSALPTAGLFEGTLASSALLAHWDELTAEQRAAASRLLVGPDGSFVTGATPVERGTAPARTASIGRSAPFVPRVAHTAAEYAPLVDQARSAIEAHLGLSLHLPIRVRTGEPGAGDPWDAETTGYIGTDPAPAGSVAEGCLITFARSASTRGAAAQTSVVAHEVFHCFQEELSNGTDDAMADWTIEGQAAWVGETIAGGSTASTTWWDGWLQHPWYRLFHRTYDAIGLYAVLDAHGRDPWSFMPAMLRVVPSEEQFSVATGGDAALIDVGTAETRLPAFGDDWESTGPGITRAQARIPVTVAAGSPVVVREGIQHRATQGFAVTVRGDILTLDADADLGAVAFTGGATARITSGVRGSWCVRDGGCVCPDGTTPSASGHPVVPGGRGPVALAVAVADVRPEFAVHLAALRLADACRDATSSSGTGTPACLTGSFHLTDQRLAAPIASALGELTLSGGVGGRRIELHDDGTYAVSDDGSDPVTVTANVGGIATTSTANVVAQGTGRFEPHPGSVDFTSESLTGTVTVATDVAGQHIESSQPLDATGLGGVYGFSGPAAYDCSGDRLSLAFPNVTFVLQRD